MTVLSDSFIFGSPPIQSLVDMNTIVTKPIQVQILWHHFFSLSLKISKSCPLLPSSYAYAYKHINMKVFYMRICVYAYDKLHSLDTLYV